MAAELRTVVSTAEEEKSYFDGGYFAYIGYSILMVLVTVLTLGIAYPFIFCARQRWLAKHTVISGKRMYFNGTGLQLWGKYLLWMLLSTITLGIYSFWMRIAFKKWVTKHTHYEGEIDNNSYFDGSILGFIGTNIICILLTLATFGIGKAWADKIMLAWESKHTVIDSRRHIFTATGGSLFVKYLLWGFLSGITFGIFALFVPVKRLRWEAENTIDHEHTSFNLMRASEYKTNVHTDAASYKAYQVEDEMELMRAGVTNCTPQDELLQLAQSGNRAAQYAYVSRYSRGAYGASPFVELLADSARQGYAPAMNLYTALGMCSTDQTDAMLERAANRGQVEAMCAMMRKKASAALSMPEGREAVTIMREAVRWYDLLADKGETVLNSDVEANQKCVLAIRRYEAKEALGKPSNAGKVAAIIGVIIAIPILLALLAGLVLAVKEILPTGSSGNFSGADGNGLPVASGFMSIFDGFENAGRNDGDMVDSVMAGNYADSAVAGNAGSSDILWAPDVQEEPAVDEEPDAEDTPESGSPSPSYSCETSFTGIYFSAYDSESISLATDYFSVVIPDSWADEVYITVTDGDYGGYAVAFHDKVSWEQGYNGYFGSIYLEDENDYFPTNTILGSIPGSGYVVTCGYTAAMLCAPGREDIYGTLTYEFDNVVASISILN